MKVLKILFLAVLSGFSALNSFAQTWGQIGLPVTNWCLVASSADGVKMIAVTQTQTINNGEGGFPGGINYYLVSLTYISTNSGVTWTQTVATNNWTSIVSSADGTKFVAGAGGIYVSTNSGDAWVQSDAPANNWHSIASSADGNRLIAGAYGDGDSVYISTNAGTAWQPTSAPLTNSLGYSNYWLSVASSANGKVLAAAAGNWEPGAICISTNSGATWTETSAPITNWWTVAVSANGSELAAGVEYGLIYVSTNFGLTWTPTSAPTSDWQSISVSADGSRLAAACQPVYLPPPDEISPGSIYTSTNFGVDWVSNNIPFARWADISSSADGDKLIAVNYNGEMWISQTLPSPSMNAMSSNANLLLSWLVPSTNFVLQQSFDLSSWADLTNQPVLNLTNLQNEVCLPLSGSSAFFRLKTP